MDDLLSDFLIESNENLERLDQEIVELESNPDDLEILKSIFRTIHTVKGSCGFLGLSRMEEVSHIAEDVLGKMRDGELRATPDNIGPVLNAVDTIKEILAGLEATGVEPVGDDSEVIRALGHVLESHAGAASEDVSAEGEPADAPCGGVDAALFVEASAVGDNDDAEEIGDTHNIVEDADSADIGEKRALAEIESSVKEAVPPPRSAPSVPVARSNLPERKQKEPGADTSAPASVSVANQSLRVGVAVLDRLMNRVGELVLVRNQLGQLAQNDENSEYKSSILELSRVTTELQEAVMQTRMREIGNAWKKIPRILRDLTSASGKKIQLEMIGAETELDRQVLDAIEDPFIHMVRNSADHGIESVEERRAAGKPDTGTVTLRAHHEGGYIIIEIVDDGRGMDVQRVREKAVERGLISEEAAEVLHDDEVLNFIFEPGFSTVQKITSVSGRGVGMDVVRSKIQAIGGTVRLHTRIGEGTTVHIKIPLTLAIISALIVSSGDQSFAIPQVGVVELVRISDENRDLIEDVNGAEAMRLRGKLLSLVHLNRILDLEDAGGEDKYVIVIQVDKKQFGLVVDAVHDTEEIVVKPLGRFASGFRVYAGTTILGDGRVIMILDAAGLAGQAGIMARLETQRQDDEERESARSGLKEKIRLLLFRTGGDSTQAIPLSLVSRLEEFEASKIEMASGQHLIQYRGTLLPLISADPILQIGARDPQPVIVFSEGSKAMGLMVQEINDITEEYVTIEPYRDKPGVLGSAIIKERATEILDLHYYLDRVSGNWFGGMASGVADQARAVLVVDDSEFFKNLLSPVLMSAGHRVAMASDGEEALARLHGGYVPDIILCDIEMPKMDGLEFARCLKSIPELESIPILALTSRQRAADVAVGTEAGFLRYLSKLDTEAVLSAINELAVGEAVYA